MAVRKTPSKIFAYCQADVFFMILPELDYRRFSLNSEAGIAVMEKFCLII